jgi:hypothetical protein
MELLTFLTRNCTVDFINFHHRVMIIVLLLNKLAFMVFRIEKMCIDTCIKGM